MVLEQSTGYVRARDPVTSDRAAAAVSAPDRPRQGTKSCDEFVERRKGRDRAAAAAVNSEHHC